MAQEGKIVRVLCPNLQCRRVLGVPETARGRTVRCGSCGAHVKIPNRKAVRPTKDNSGGNAQVA